MVLLQRIYAAVTLHSCVITSDLPVMLPFLLFKSRLVAREEAMDWIQKSLGVRMADLCFSPPLPLLMTPEWVRGLHRGGEKGNKILPPTASISAPHLSGPSEDRPLDPAPYGLWWDSFSDTCWHCLAELQHRANATKEAGPQN